MKGRTLFQLPNVSSNPHLWALEIKWCNSYTICRKTDKYISNINDLLSQPGHSLASLLNGSCKNGTLCFNNQWFLTNHWLSNDETNILGTLKYLWLVGDLSKMIICLGHLLKNHIMVCRQGHFSTKAISETRRGEESRGRAGKKRKCPDSQSFPQSPIASPITKV